MQKRKGFTLVELVIVIAVIAILAGVLIGTFASVINRANASAEVQKTKSEEIAQKAEDILKKIEDSNWYGWEDFETSIVAKITQELKNQSSGLTGEQVQKIVTDALTTWQANQQAGNTELTAEQVKAIVENAVGTLHYEGVTEAQVRAIVNASEKTVLANSIQPAQIKQIVNAANANNLTAAQVASVVTSASNTTVEQIVAALSSSVEGLATSVQVEELRDDIKALAVSATDDVVLAKGLNIKLKKSGLTTTTAVHPTVVFETIQVVPSVKMGASAENDIMWDSANNSFVVVKLSGETYVYSENAATETAVGDKYKLWKVVNAIDSNSLYSQYLLGTTASGAINVVAGIDVGQNTEVTEINYNRTTGDAQTVVIRTNGERTALNVNAPNDTVHHYDFLDDLTVTAVASASYHEHGTVRGKTVISQGHIEIEDGAIVPQISVENATGAVKVTANERTIIAVDTASANQTTVVATSNDVFVSGLSEDKISGDVVVAESASDETSLLSALANGYVQLNSDVTLNDNLTISKTAVIDLNGYTFTVNGLIFNNGDLTIKDSKDNGQKKVLNVENDAVSAKTSTNVSTEASLSYTKVLQGTLKVDSIITSANSNLTILNGSFVSELDYHKYYGTSNQTNGLIYVAENGNAVIYDGAFFSENLEDATVQYAAAPVAVVSNYGNTVIYKGEFVTKYCRETYDKYFDGKAHSVNEQDGLYNKDRMQYSYYTISSFGGNIVISPKSNDDIVVYAARGALSLNAGKATINGGTFNAYHYYAAYIAGSAGKVQGTIAGGEFNLIDGGHLAAKVALDIGNDTVGDGGNRQPANVIILDCIVNSDKNAIKVANSTGTIVVYGGKYNKTISNSYIDENNYEIVEENGYFVVKSK